MLNGCCDYCYKKLPIDDYTKDEFLEYSVLAKSGDACIVCNNVIVRPRHGGRIYKMR